MNSLSTRTRAELVMFVIAFIWGASFVIVKDALFEVGPYLFLGLRFLLAFVILVTLAWHSMKTIRPVTVGYGCLLGVFLFSGYVFQTVGLKYTTASNAGFISGISVVLVPIIYTIFKRTLPEIKTVVTVLTALAGLYLMSFPDNSLRLSYGDFLVLLSALGFALHIVCVDRFSLHHNAVAITAVQIFFVGILSLMIGLGNEPWPAHISSRLAGDLLVTSVFATSLAFLMQNALQKYSTPTRFAVVLTTEPVFAAIVAYLWAGESFTYRALAGAALIFGSMLISILTRKPKEPTVEQI